MALAAFVLALRGKNPVLCVFIFSYAAMLILLIQPDRHSRIIHGLATLNAIIFGMVVFYGVFVVRH